MNKEFQSKKSFWNSLSLQMEKKEYNHDKLRTKSIWSNKKGIEFSFAWIFAIIVGAVIIFLAIYSATKLIKTERSAGDSERAKEIEIILNPIQTYLESGKSSKIELPYETRLYNECEEPTKFDVFGAQEIRVASKSGIGKKYESPGEPTRFLDKYLFSDKVVEGNEYYIISKPFLMPFKISDIIIISSSAKNYCFVNPPSIIEEDVENLGLSNVNVTYKVSECKSEDIKVCFSNKGCDIDVTLDLSSNELRGSINKEKINYYFEGNLIYAAIFSDPEIYECGLRRMMARASEISLLLLDKSAYLTSKGCGSGIMASELIKYSNGALALNSSLDLSEVRFIADEMDRVNGGLSCKLY